MRTNSNRRYGLLIAFCATIIIASCSKPEPPQDQAAISQRTAAFAAQIKQARDSNNDIAVKESEKAAKEYLSSINASANGWQAVVEKVTEQQDGAVVIYAKSITQEYALQLVDPRAKTWAAAVGAGTQILFSGQVGPERSITLDGGLSNPEFRLYPTAIRRAKEKTETVQAQEHIDAHLSKIRQGALEQRAKENIRTVCHNIAKTKFNDNAKLDFGILDAEFEQTAPLHYAYSNIVTAENIYGAERRFGMVCLAEYALEDNGAMKVRVSGITVKQIR